MRKLTPAAILLFLLTIPVSAGDDGLSGTWKLSIFEGGRQISFWLMDLKSKDGQLSVKGEALKGAPSVEATDPKMSGDTFTFKLKATVVEKGEKFTVMFDFEGKLPKPGAKKILGSLSQGGANVPAWLEATTAKNNFELDRELVTRNPGEPKAFQAMFDLIENAPEKKVDPKDLEEWIALSLKAAEGYGPRFLAQQQYRLLDTLNDHKAHSALALSTAQKITKQIDAKAPLDAQLQLLTLISDIYRKAGQKEGSTAIELRVEKLEDKAHSEYEKTALEFKLGKVEARKGKGHRAVLVELFTGAQCPPCVAADMAFDGLERTYAHSDVVLLQYHVHIPRPDPLANVDSDARYEYYADFKKARGTPSILFNGKPAAPGGGFRDDAEDKYKEYVGVVNKLLELPGGTQFSATATRAGDKITIAAKVKDLATPGDKVRLRFVLVEDWARYRGSNGLQYHHRVVRAMPGGAKGFTLKAKDAEQIAEVDLEKLRKQLNKYLDEDYPDGPRPMRMRNLRVVAFVQNDETTEVLNAIDVPVEDKK